MVELYYYGCGPDDTGHFFWSINERYSSMRGPHGPWAYEVDGGLQPSGSRGDVTGFVEGVVALHRKDGWTAIAWWDQSKDTRPGSCSAFVFKAPDISYEDAMAMAREKFPWVFSRITFELRKQTGSV